MDTVAALPAEARRDLFREAANALRMTPAVVEKDFWVTWVLDRLFSQAELARLLMFKGGTSLSKAFGLIERFSEDIDLILDWRVLGNEDPLAERSRNQQNRLNEDIDTEARHFIAGPLLQQIAAALANTCACSIASDDGHVIEVRYPAAFSDDYLRPEVRLEIGPLAAWLPHETRSITSYAAQAFPRLFKRPQCPVRVIGAERTFWEKATILHHEVFRPDPIPPTRYSRHYYDLARIAASPVKPRALANLALLADVVAFKQRFYPRGWARYDLAVAGTMRLIPDEAMLKALATDYRSMSHMIFGELPSFINIIDQLRDLEAEINSHP